MRRLALLLAIIGLLVAACGDDEGGTTTSATSATTGTTAAAVACAALLIADEVQSGIGRTGKWWGIQHWGVEPDMVACAKGIASGMPIAAMVARS